MVEDFRVPAQRVAECRALLDAGFDVPKDVREMLVVGLPLQDVEALDDGQTRVNHRGEQAREGDDVFLADSRADLKFERLDLFLDPRRLQLLRAQALIDRVLGLGLHETFADLAGPCARFPDEFRHCRPQSSVQGARTPGQSYSRRR